MNKIQICSGTTCFVMGGNVEAVRSVIINGLNKISIQNLKSYTKSGKCSLRNLIEVMSCEGGCIAGNAGLEAIKKRLKNTEIVENL